MLSIQKQKQKPKQKNQPLKNEILVGNAYDMLDYIPTEYIHCCVTSPPYWNLRDYGDKHQIGVESSAMEYVVNLCDIMEKVHRVLRSDGTLWLNIGDSYEDKNLAGVPWKVVDRMKDMGFILRSDIIWHKTNAMPDSAKDRPGASYEHLFLFSKTKEYYYDYVSVSANKNLRDVWSIPTKSMGIKHFATYPEKLVSPCIMAGTSEYGVCRTCSSPFVRVVGYSEEYENVKGKGFKGKLEGSYMTEGKRGVGPLPPVETMYVTLGWEATCECWNQHENREAAIVLDPFMGSGTTARVAKNLGRYYIGIELNPEYAKIINQLTAQEELLTWQ